MSNALNSIGDGLNILRILDEPMLVTLGMRADGRVWYSRKHCQTTLIDSLERLPDNQISDAIVRFAFEMSRTLLRHRKGGIASTRHERPISRQTAELVFKRVREQAGLERPACLTFPPRLHDFRQHVRNESIGQLVPPG
jgi:hypothetical protein